MTTFDLNTNGLFTFALAGGRLPAALAMLLGVHAPRVSRTGSCSTELIAPFMRSIIGVTGSPSAFSASPCSKNSNTTRSVQLRQTPVPLITLPMSAHLMTILSTSSFSAADMAATAGGVGGGVPARSVRRVRRHLVLERRAVAAVVLAGKRRRRVVRVRLGRTAVVVAMGGRGRVVGVADAVADAVADGVAERA